MHRFQTFLGLACTCANMGALLPALVGPNMVTDPNFIRIEPSLLRLEIQNYFMICKYSFKSSLFVNDSYNKVLVVTLVVICISRSTSSIIDFKHLPSFLKIFLFALRFLQLKGVNFLNVVMNSTQC